MLKKGLVIDAKLIEAVDNTHWIASFHGQLLQVVNTTDLKFSANQTLRLQVIKENPLEFKILIPLGDKKAKIDFIV
jgi:hypothetical protein